MESDELDRVVTDMDWDREEREYAIREADRLQAEFERDEWLRAQRAKRSASEIVHKTYEPRQAQQRPSAIMDAITQAAWDTWVKDHIAIALEEHLEKVLTPAMGEVISEIRHQLRSEFNEALASLRADMTIQTAIAKGEIAEIKRKDVA